jgi:hypothetical protein
MKFLRTYLVSSILLGGYIVNAAVISQTTVGLIGELNRLFRRGQVCELRNHPVKGQPFPSLIDVTLDDLTTGLESGLFTSVDLVTV